MLWSILIGILGFIFSPLFKAIKGLFITPPEELQRRRDAAKISNTIKRLASDDPGFKLRNGARQDQWGGAPSPGARVESAKQDDPKR